MLIDLRDADRAPLKLVTKTCPDFGLGALGDLVKCNNNNYKNNNYMNNNNVKK